MSNITATPRHLLRDIFGFDDFRPGQRAVMSALWNERAALAVFPTGGGKSLCYQLPALMFDGVTLVVSPLIALMKDQIDYLKARGISAEKLDASLTADDSRAVMEGMRTGSLKIVYVAPERFNNERFITNLRQSKISLFAVDEAHCISEWGHNFRPDYLKLAEMARAIGAERVLALTATATPTVVEDICSAFSIPANAAIVTGFYRQNLSLRTTPVSVAERDAALAARLQERPPGPSIVYVTLQRTSEQIANSLAAVGLPAKPYHAGMSDDARSAVQEWWMKSIDGIVVATIAFGMGIDKANVRYVYHYNLPKSLESYCQEIGRAGRDGLPSIVELLACQADVPVLENFAHGDTPSVSGLRGLVDHVISAPSEFDIDLYELSFLFDIRQLVLRTALTYMELSGLIRQGTPFYAGYAVRSQLPLPEIISLFPGEPGRFLERLFEAAPKSPKAQWRRINPDVVAAQLGVERKRVIRALEVMEERGLIELSASDFRTRFSRLKDGEDPAALTADLVRKFQRREHQEVLRVQAVLRLVRHDGCQTNALTAYFGEQRPNPCGHCSYCMDGTPKQLHPTPKPPLLPEGVDTADLARVRLENPAALGDDRQAARFLCGLSSPAATRAKLSRQPLFGALADRRFMEVLTWLGEQQ